MSETFKQCELVKPVQGGTARMLSWIPSRIAIVDNTVRLRETETSEQTECWRVNEVTEPALPGKLLERWSGDVLRNRNASMCEMCSES